MFTPLHSCVSVLMDIAEKVQDAVDYDECQLSDEDYQDILDLIEVTFRVPEVLKVVNELLDQRSQVDGDEVPDLSRVLPK